MTDFACTISVVVIYHYPLGSDKASHTQRLGFGEPLKSHYIAAQ